MFYSLWTSGYTIRRKRATNIATGPCRQSECSGPEAAEADHIATDHKWRIKNGIPPAPLGVRSSIARSVISKRCTQRWLRDHAEERLSRVFQDNYDHGNAAVHICRHIWLAHSAVSSNEYGFIEEAVIQISQLINTKHRFNSDTEEMLCTEASYCNGREIAMCFQ